jgi:nucleoside-diphosphate-sugar epimerase
VYLKGKRLLVAGGTGLAGSAVLRHLLAVVGDVRVRVPHQGRTGAFVKDARVEYVTGDLTRPEDCARVAAGCDCAVLAAARTGGARHSRERPWEQVTDNLVMDARLLEALHKADVRRAVYVGTASSYQDFTGAIKEDALDWSADPPAAYFGVGWAKRSAEKLCRFWHEASGMEILVARLANVYGPFARFDPASSNFVAALVRKATAGEDPFVVWGDPQVGRDILYADDFGRAAVAMLEATSIRFDVFNIGSGRVTTVDEVAKLALRFSGHNPTRIVYDKNAPTTVAHRLLDCGKARVVLGWQPEVTAEEGVRRTVEWWKANRETWQR